MSQTLRSTRPTKASPVRRVVLALIAVFVLGTLVAGLWLAFRSAPTVTQASVFDQSAAAGTHEPLSAQNVARLHPVWNYTVFPDFPGKLLVANGITYVKGRAGEQDYLIALQQGNVLWRYQPPGQSPDYSIQSFQVGGSAVFVATPSAIAALDARTGQPLWQYQAESPIAVFGPADALIYADGMLYFSTDEQVHALDASSGALVWSYRYTADHTAPYSPFGATLAAGAGRVYLCLATSPYRVQPAITALDARTGQVQWQVQESDASPSIVLTLSPAFNEIIRSTVWGTPQIRAYDATTGKFRWYIHAAGSPGLSQPGVAAGPSLLYVTEAGAIHAYDLNTGQFAWSTAALAGAEVRLWPLVRNGIIYATSITPFNPRGRSLFGPPARTPHWLYAFDAASGRTLAILQSNDATFEVETLQADDAQLYVVGSRSFIGADQSVWGKPDVYALGV